MITGVLMREGESLKSGKEPQEASGSSQEEEAPRDAFTITVLY